MSICLGDLKKDSVVYFCWSTFNKNGSSTSRSTDGTIKIYKDDGSSECTVGITDTENFDSLTGVHNCKIDTGADSFYAPGHDYSVVLVGAVIDGETVNTVLASFSIENRFAGSSLFEKAAKMLINKAVQNKITGAIDYYDDDNSTVILTHTPDDSQDSISRMPS